MLDWLLSQKWRCGARLLRSWRNMGQLWEQGCVRRRPEVASKVRLPLLHKICCLCLTQVTLTSWLMLWIRTLSEKWEQQDSQTGEASSSDPVYLSSRDPWRCPHSQEDRVPEGDFPACLKALPGIILPRESSFLMADFNSSGEIPPHFVLH